MKPSFTLIVLCGISFAGNPALENMAADSWMSVPNSTITPFCPSDADYPGINGTGGCAMVVDAWSGGCYIGGPHCKMIVWGGGHNDYYGNEVFAFDISTLKWSLFRAPSKPNLPSVCTFVLTGGAPVSRHTYDGLAYMEHIDRMFAFGGSGACLNSGKVNQVWLFNLNDTSWQYMRATLDDSVRACCSGTCAYDPVSRKVYYQDNLHWWAYTYETNAWVQVAGADQWSDKTTAIDTKRGLMVTIGGGICWVVDLRAPVFTVQTLQTTGGSTVINAGAPGVAYDSKADRIVAWSGGSPYALDMDTRVWTAKSSSGAPGSPAMHNTYGRWRYIPEENVFILVNGVDENVYFYKLTAGPGTSSEQNAQAGPSAGASITVSPNPAQVRTFIRVFGLMTGECRLYDVQGRLADHFLINLAGQPATQGIEFSWDASRHPAGLYLLKVSDGTKTLLKRILVQK